jgi:hypothetical protein
MHEDFVNLSGVYRRFLSMVETINQVFCFLLFSLYSIQVCTSQEIRKMEDVAQLAFFEDHLVFPDGSAPFKLSLPGRSLISETEVVVIESLKSGRRLSFSKNSTTKIKETPAVVGRIF